MAYPGGIIENLGDLTNAVADWLWRTGDENVAAATPQYIANFEADFKRKARTLEMQEVAYGSVTDSTYSDGTPSAVVATPSDYLEMIRFQLVNLPSGTPNQVLKYVPPARAGALDSVTAPAGVVEWYTILAGNFVITPQKWVPSGCDYELAYYGFTSLFNADGGVNWLLTKHPDGYLFGALMQAAAYIDDKDTVAFWEQERDKAIGGLIEADKKAKVGGPLQMLPSMQFRTRRRLFPGMGA